jgi:hypothetical protein
MSHHKEIGFKNKICENHTAKTHRTITLLQAVPHYTDLHRCHR